jgi:hypothetical protein
MPVARTIRPPSGANSIILIHAHADWAVLWYPALSGLVSPRLAAIVWSRLCRGLAPYPAEPLAPLPQKLDGGGWGP